MFNILVTEFEESISKLSRSEMAELIINLEACVDVLPPHYVKQACMKTVLMIIRNVNRKAGYETL